MISSSVSLCLSQSKLGYSLRDFVSLSHGVFSSSFNCIDKNRYCLITNPNFFFEFLRFFVFSHFLIDFHRISLIFLSHISQKTQKSVVSSHLDSNTANSTRLITGLTLSYEMLIVDCWLLIVDFEIGKFSVPIDCLFVRLNLCSILK